MDHPLSLSVEERAGLDRRQRRISSAVTQIGPLLASIALATAIARNSSSFSKKRAAVARGGEAAFRRPRRVTVTNLGVSPSAASWKTPVKFSALNSAEATEYAFKRSFIPSPNVCMALGLAYPLSAGEWRTKSFQDHLMLTRRT